jgi:predicted ATPase
MDAAPRELPGGTVTFLFSDVEGSTRLASALGDRFAEVLEGHRRVVRAALAAHIGVEVSTAGDSFFAVFSSASDGAAAAVAIEAGLRADPAGSGDEPIRVRIGLHTGQAVRVGHDYVGLDVHLAARVSDAAHGGQILVSEATHAAIAERLPHGSRITDLGRHRLKDVGPQRIWQLDGPGRAPDRFSVLRSLEAHPSNLPVAVSPLVDRQLECAELADLVARSSIVTVTGAGGIGKSRVALEVARSIVSRFPDGLFHLDLIAIPDASTVAGALLELMSPRASPDLETRVALLDRLRSRDLLLVLDTADRVEDLPGLVAGIAASCPRIRVLLTSRSRLRLAAEVEYPLAPLPTDPAIELFNARAQAARGQSMLDPGSRPVVERLVARLDGIPLAIELAAARTRIFTPAALLDRLERSLPSLGEGARDLPDRQRTLHDTIEWSCELLQPGEQAAFRELGVFAGSFDLAAVEAVVRPSGGGDAIVLLESLVDRSLVVADQRDDGEPRFRLLRPIREFALDALRADGREDAVRERHARHWVAFVTERLDRPGQPGLAMLRDVEVNEADLRAALEWTLQGGGGEMTRLGLELAGELGRYWWLRGRVQEGVSWLERGLAAAVGVPATEAGPIRIRARALFWAGVLLNDAGRAIQAADRLEACLALQRQAGDDIGVARTLNSLGVVASTIGDLERAETLLEESIERKRALGDRSGIPVTLSNLGIVASDRGRYDDAVRFMAEALEIDEGLGGGSVVVSHANLGASLIRAGRHQEGLAEIRLAQPGIAGLRDPVLVVESLTSLAWVALGAEGDAAARRGARLAFAADAVREREGLPLRPAERTEVDELAARVSARLDAGALAPLRAEARAIDLDAALTLAGEALGEVTDPPG